VVTGAVVVAGAVVTAINEAEGALPLKQRLPAEGVSNVFAVLVAATVVCSAGRCGCFHPCCCFGIRFFCRRYFKRQAGKNIGCGVFKLLLDDSRLFVSLITYSVSVLR